MKIYTGKSVMQGIAVGKIYLYEKKKYRQEKKTNVRPGEENYRFEAARKDAINQLEELGKEAFDKTGTEQAMIFEAHRMILEDEVYRNAVREKIFVEHVNAEYAVYEVGERFAANFAGMQDTYMKERAADVKDVTERILQILSGCQEKQIRPDKPVILIAEDLTPSETIQMDKSKILAFVTRKGSANSHTAIVAKAMNIPALVGTKIELLREYQGKEAIVDGMEGKLILEPDQETLSQALIRKERLKKEQAGLRELIGAENVTKDGQRIELYANIEITQEVEDAIQNDAGGIGLFRSEFLYLGKNSYPSEEEQYENYREVIERMQGRKVIIRTMDIGADKRIDYFQLPEEANPAMGYRAIRICLDRKDIFKTQLRAIYRAAAYGNTAIMFPMIISVQEVKAIKELIREIKEELKAENLPCGEVELGVMIETPAAALISDKLAEEVDFFSIGTNDLTQYTLAIDRQNPYLDPIYDPYHPSVLKLIELITENAHKAGIWVGICGELAVDTTLTEWFLKLGIDELSVPPSFLLKVRNAVRKIG